jgi:hypothetical protein
LQGTAGNFNHNPALPFIHEDQGPLRLEAATHLCAGVAWRGARRAPAERDGREAPGRPRGRFGTEACVIADGAGRAVALAVAPGQAHELPIAPGLLDRLPRVPRFEPRTY